MKQGSSQGKKTHRTASLRLATLTLLSKEWLDVRLACAGVRLVTQHHACSVASASETAAAATAADVAVVGGRAVELGRSFRRTDANVDAARAAHRGRR